MSREALESHAGARLSEAVASMEISEQPEKAVECNGGSETTQVTPANESSLSDTTDTQQSSQAESTPEAAPVRKAKPKRLVKTVNKEGGLVQLVREQADEIKQLREQLDTAEGERDDIQDQYDDLLEKVTHIKGTLGERLKADAVRLVKCQEELDGARAQIAAATEAKDAAEQTIQNLKAQLSQKTTELETEIETLKSQTASGAASHQQELKQLKQERDRLGLSLESLKGELQKVAKEKLSLDMALGDERTQRSSFESKIAQISEELTTQTGYAEHYRDSSLRAERELAQLTAETNQKIERLEQNIQALELEKSRFKEQLREQADTLQSKDSELEEAKKQLLEGEDLQRQVKEKNLQIGKLRHEAVILNDHLTNALATVRRGSQGQSIDKELISNLVLQFASIPRGDSKKYEVLQLISNTLDWDESQQAQAGLARAQSSGDGGGSGGLFGKFAEFLERESNKGRNAER